MKILVIDPSKSFRQLIKETLESNDITVRCASTAIEAITQLNTDKYAAVCMSYELEDMTGFDFIDLVNRDKDLKDVPKFLLTSKQDNAFKHKAYNAGFTEIFIKKDFNTLKRALHSIMLHATLRIKAKILYVEDSKSTAQYTTQLMHNAGWDVTHVESAEQALEILNSSQEFDLVITDLILRGELSGLGLINLIRQGDSNVRNLPILAVSGWNDLLRQIFVLQNGASDFIAKPFHSSDFIARALNLILSQRELKELRLIKDSLQTKANIDPVTQLNNRHFLEEFSSKIVKHAQGQNNGIAILILDLDKFKNINDQYGHLFGDEVLQRVASTIKISIPSNSIVARFGGDEFVAIISDITLEKTHELTEEIRSKIENLNPNNTFISATLGAAFYDKSTEENLLEMLQTINYLPGKMPKINYDSLFAIADNCLYQAKDAGRNRVCVNNKVSS